MVEYGIDEINVCTHCGKNDKLMTPEERMGELKEKVVDMQDKDRKKKHRRAKWENWKKT